MKLGPAIHGGLLVVALLVAYKGWNKEETKKPDVGTVAVWTHDAAGFTGIAFEAERKSVRASWKSEGGERYLWGEVSRSTPKKGKKPKKGEPVAPEDLETTIRNFPVDVEKGDAMIMSFSGLKALSALGVLDDAKKKEFGLAESKENLSVSFKDGQENLIVGARVYGGSDRYVLHAESNKAFVISSEILRPLEAGETSLRLKKLHGFENTQVARVKVDSQGASKEMVKTEISDDKGTREAWAYAATPKKADLTLDSFLDRAEKLSPVEFLTEDPGAELIVRLSYQGKTGKELGYLEFFRKVPPELAKKEGEDDKKTEEGVPDALADPEKAEAAKEKEKEKPKKAPEIEYFVRTERTRVWGKVSRLAAERFDQDVASLFEREPPPTTPVPEKKARPPMPGHGGPGARPGAPGAHPGGPGHPGAMPGRPGATPGRPGAMPGRPGAMPGRPGAMPGRPGVKPGKPGVKPAVKKPAVKKPAVKKPAVKKPAVKKPAVKKPAVKKPAVKKPAPK